MKLTQKSFDKLVEGLNHRITKVEISLKWVKYIVGYMATLLTLLTINSLVS